MENENPKVDIPKSVVVILVVLAVVVSVLGTWTVMNQVSTVPVQASGAQGNPTQTARVALTVKNPVTVQTTGRIAFTYESEVS
ncbi:hypothetical protein JW930_07680 [Candidatus Woesearchaeota archaeon]|nr:hypothetical protein [Candidatus Woesearchaeota archaeon]